MLKRRAKPALARRSLAALALRAGKLMRSFAIDIPATHAPDSGCPTPNGVSAVDLAAPLAPEAVSAPAP